MGRSRQTKRISGEIKELEYEDLIEIVRGKHRKKTKNLAYEEVERRIKLKIIYISRKFYIPGLNFDDILQEALYALRFKAIPDYDKEKVVNKTSSSFDNFAALCIRRHLSTLLKSSYQNKKKTLNTSISLDQDRSFHDDEDLYLIDIISATNGSVIDDITKKEYYQNLFKKLYRNLSRLEKNVFLLYTHKYSYDEITFKMNEMYKRKGMKKRVNVKSIDNSLSRIKVKGKEIFEKYEEE